MNYKDFSRTMILTFVASFMTTVMVCFVVSTLGIADLIYLGPLAGLFIFAYFGMNLLVDDGVIPNNYYRLILAAVCIIIYCFVFVTAIPMLFGPDFLLTDHTLASFGYAGFGSDFTLNCDVYLALFSIIVMILNLSACEL